MGTHDLFWRLSSYREREFALGRGSELPGGRERQMAPSTGGGSQGGEFHESPPLHANHGAASTRAGLGRRKTPPFSQFPCFLSFPLHPPFLLLLQRLIPSQFTFTMGSLANGSQPGTFLFTSESVGEGHPDKIAFVSPPDNFCYSRPLLSDLNSHAVTRSRTPFSMPVLPRTPSPRSLVRPPPRPVGFPVLNMCLTSKSNMRNSRYDHGLR